MRGTLRPKSAGEFGTRMARTFDAQVIPSVAYTHPEVAWVGITEEQAKKEGRKVEVAKFPWAASGRAIANGADYGFTKLIFDAETHRVIGGAIVGPSAGDMISEICLAIEMGCDAVDIGKTIHPHPTLGETVGMAAEVAHGTCTDMPAAAEEVAPSVRSARRTIPRWRDASLPAARSVSSAAHPGARSGSLASQPGTAPSPPDR